MSPRRFLVEYVEPRRYLKLTVFDEFLRTLAIFCTIEQQQFLERMDLRSYDVSNH